MFRIFIYYTVNGWQIPYNFNKEKNTVMKRFDANNRTERTLFVSLLCQKTKGRDNKRVDSIFYKFILLTQQKPTTKKLLTPQSSSCRILFT